MKISFNKKSRTATLTAGVTKNKNLYVNTQIDVSRKPLFYWEWRVNRKTSHEGLFLQAGLFGGHLELEFADNRHWNSREGRWYIEGEEEKEQQKAIEMKENFVAFINKAKADPTTCQELIGHLEKYVRGLSLERFPIFYSSFFDLDDESP